MIINCWCDCCSKQAACLATLVQQALHSCCRADIADVTHTMQSVLAGWFDCSKSRCQENWWEANAKPLPCRAVLRVGGMDLVRCLERDN